MVQSCGSSQPRGYLPWHISLGSWWPGGGAGSEDGSGSPVEKGLQVRKVVGDGPQEASVGIPVRTDTA